MVAIRGGKSPPAGSVRVVNSLEFLEPLRIATGLSRRDDDLYWLHVTTVITRCVTRQMSRQRNCSTEH